MQSVLKTILVDDHQIFLQGLKTVLKDTGVKVVGTASNGREAIELLQTLKPDLALIDLNLPGVDGLEILQFISSHKLSTKTLILTMYTDPKIVRKALKGGAGGYLLKDQDACELHQAINEVMKGKTYLGKGLSALRNQAGEARKQRPAVYDDLYPKKHYLTKRRWRSST